MAGEAATVADGNWYVLLAGLPSFANSVVLAPGLGLRPLESPLSVFDLAAVGAVGFRGWAALEQFAHACTAEVESAKDANVTPGYDTLNRAWLATGLLVLRGFTRLWGMACSGYSWNLVAGHQIRNSGHFQEQAQREGIDKAVFEPKHSLPPFRGNLLDYHLNGFTDAGCRFDAPNEADAEWVRTHFDTFNQLASENEAFSFALEAAMDWRFAKEPRSAVARLWGGIEALFGVNSELVHRISLYAACLLATRGEARKRKFDEVKGLYGLRSKVVHGEKLPDEKISAAMSDSFHLLRDLLLLAVERGKPITTEDVEQAVFF
jgi:Apea-like HEPN